jgi:UDP-glucose 4-epimerase
MQRVIVTGGAGFIGSHTVVELALAGFKPVVVDDLRNAHERALQGIARILGHEVEVHRADCGDLSALRKIFAQAPVHGVVHFAADKSVPESVADPLKYYTNNIGGTATVLRAMAEHGVRSFVFSSSCTVYGTPRHAPVSELDPVGSTSNPYGYTKVVCEQMVQDAVAATPSLAAVLLRYFNPIGAHTTSHIGELPIGPPMNLVPYLTQVAAGSRERLVVHGADYATPDGSCIRDYIHVVDLAQAHVRALQWMQQRPAPLCEAFNLGTGKGHSVLEVVRTFKEATGVDVPYTIGPRRPGDVEAIWAATEKSSSVLGWKAGLGLADCLRDAWRWQLSLTR